jgi:hypothetical protein
MIVKAGGIPRIFKGLNEVRTKPVLVYPIIFANKNKRSNEGISELWIGKDLEGKGRGLI